MQNLPDRRELNFSEVSILAGADIEKCLHNGLIEAEMQRIIDDLRQQVDAIEDEWHSAPDASTTKLFKRYRLSGSDECPRTPHSEYHFGQPPAVPVNLNIHKIYRTSLSNAD